MLCKKGVKTIKKEIEFPRMIYAITHLETGKKYIGSSYNPKKRFEQHMNRLKNGCHPVEDMQMDYNEKGKCYNFEILDFSNNEDSLKEYQFMEREETYKREKGYNYKDIKFQKYFYRKNINSHFDTKDIEDMIKLLKSCDRKQLLRCYGFSLGLKAMQQER